MPEDFPAEIVVRLDTGPEVLAGSTRMKAGSATKMVLNALSLGAMARLGKVHGNRMVDVRVGSEKLRRRACVPSVASDLRFRLFQALGRAGIEIPFPQRDLHIKSGALTDGRPTR